MHRLGKIVALVLTLVGAAIAVVLTSTAPSVADCPPDPVDETGLCTSSTTSDDPDPTSDPTPGGEGGDPGSGGVGCPGAPNGECVNEYGGTWIDPPRDCYAFALDPQPQPGSPLWGTNDPEAGSIWSCDQTVSVPENTWYVPDGEGVIDPAAVARQLKRTAPFEFAEANLAPGPDYHTYIGYENWMWVPGEQWHEVSVSLAAGGARVTLTAEPTFVTWDMGNGDRPSCVGPGRAWVKGMAENAPTNCSYEYQDMVDSEADTWEVSARINYAVSWTCTGACGGRNGDDMGNVTALAGDATSITVRQRQTVVN